MSFGMTQFNLLTGSLSYFVSLRYMDQQLPDQFIGCGVKVLSEKSHFQITLSSQFSEYYLSEHLASGLTSLCLSLLICQMGMVTSHKSLTYSKYSKLLTDGNIITGLWFPMLT